MKFLLRSLAVMGPLLVAHASANAQSALSWSSTAPATSGTVGGTGTWDTSTLNWWNGTAGVTWSNAANNTAVFAGTSGTVTLNENVTAGGLSFNTTGYLVNVGANTLTLGAATNVLSLNNVASGTISGLVNGTGNVLLDGGLFGGSLTAGTLNLIGTATGGWSGTTTITQGQTLAISATSQALLNTAAINLVNGNVTLTNANDAAQAALNRISNTAPITVTNSGILTLTNTNAARIYGETTGTVSLASGEFQVNLPTTQSTGTQVLTFSGLTRTGNTASVRFAASGVTPDTTRNRIVVTGATGSGTNSGEIIGPWATVGTDYAVYDASGNVIAANITASNQDTWTTATSAYTAGSAQTLGTTRTITALRLTSTAANIVVGTAANLETYGILLTVGGTGAGSSTLSASGNGAITTPAGGGNLFIATNFTPNGTGLGTNRLRISAPINDNSGAVTVVKTGPGGLELTGSNSFTGGLTLNAGRLTFTNDNSLGAASGGITFAGNTRIDVTPGIGADRTITVNAGVEAGFYSATGQAAVAAVLAGDGIVREYNASNSRTNFTNPNNTFSGPVVISSGGNGLGFVSLGDAESVFIGSNSASTVSRFTWMGGTQVFDNRQFISTSSVANNTFAVSSSGSGGLKISRDLGFSGASTSRVFLLGGPSTGFSNEFAGRITDAPTGVVRLTKEEAGTWILSASNTFTGTTTLTGGELAISSDDNISGTASPLVFNGGTLKVLGTSLTSLNPSRPTFFTGTSGSGTISVGFNIDDPANTFTVSQDLNMTSGGLTKSGAGTLRLTGSNTYTGVTTASGGTLQLTSGNQIADTSTVAITGGSVHFETSETIGRLNVTGSGAVTAAAGATLTTGTAGYVISNPAGSSATLAANLAGSGGLAISGAGALTLSGSNSYTGGTDWSSTGSVVIVGSNQAFGSGTVSLGGNTSTSATLRASANVTLGNTFVTTVNNRTLIIDGSNSITFSGPYINQLNNIIQNNLAAGSTLAFGQLTVASGSGATGGLTLSGSGNTTIGRLTPSQDGLSGNSTTFTISNSGTTTITGTLGINRNVSPGLTLSGGGRLVIGPAAVMLSDASATFIPPIYGSNGSTLEYASNADSTLSGAISGTFSFLKTGAGAVTLTGANTFSGTIALSAGRLNVNSTTALGGVGSTFAITSGTIDNTTAGSITMTNAQPHSWNGDFTFLGTQPLALGGGTVTLGTSPVVTVESSTLTVGGPITGGFGLTKQGVGVLRLNGAGTFTGDTLVSSGTLMLGSNLALQMSGFDTSGGGVVATSGTAIRTPTLGGLIGSVDLASEFVAADYGRFSSLTLNSQGGKTYAYSGVIANGTSTGMTLTKSGPGTQVLSGLNTFTGKTNVADGVLEVFTIGNGGSASPLGQNTTVDFGAGSTSGTLRYTGAGETTTRTFNLADSTGGGGIEANGTGALAVSNAITASGTATRVFTLTGTSTAANAVAAISGTNVSVVKEGVGLWRMSGTSDFTGSFTVRNGTVVAAVNAVSNASGAFGPYDSPVVVGDAANGTTGTVAVLGEAGTTIDVGVSVVGTSPLQTVLIGGANTSGTATYGGTHTLTLGRSVAIVAATGGVVNFARDWTVTGTAPVDVAIGVTGYAGTVRLSKLATLATTGAVSVRFGTALLTQAATVVDGTGTLAIDAGATLGGIGTVAGPLGGAGLVAPGNSPGILTADSLDPTGSLDLAFEFEGPTPTYTNSGTSINDILRLTGTSPFLGQSLSSGNVVSLYLPASAATGGTFTGGFFTDMSSTSFSTFLSAVSSGSYVAYYENAGGGIFYGGKEYSALGQQVTVGTTVVPGTTNFQTNGPAVDGQVTTFTVVVPEPAAIALAGIGVVAAAWAARRRPR